MPSICMFCKHDRGPGRQFATMRQFVMTRVESRTQPAAKVIKRDCQCPLSILTRALKPPHGFGVCCVQRLGVRFVPRPGIVPRLDFRVPRKS